MNYIRIEDTFLTWLKMFDGLAPLIPTGCSSACDLSFNDFVTARYLTEKCNIPKVFAFTDDYTVNVNNIFPVKAGKNLAATLSGLNTELIVSLAGTFEFLPLYDVSYAIQRSLVSGGKFVFAVMPEVYDQNGRDVVKCACAASGLKLGERMRRWFYAFNNSLTNLFMDVQTEIVIADATMEEFSALFSSHSFNRFLFRNAGEYERFIASAEQMDGRMQFVWNVITGFKR